MGSLLPRAFELNLIACLAVSSANLLVLFRQERMYKSSHRFVYYSYFCWFLAWLTWVAFWGLMPHSTENQDMRTLGLLLSDLNTVFLVLFYLGITRGREFRVGRYFIVGVFLVILTIGIDILLHLISDTINSDVLLQHWSLALSMSTPVLVGWAFRLRYGNNLVLVISSVYAIAQLPAYEVVFGKSISPDWGGKILALLAGLKIIFAYSVLRLATCELSSCGSLVRRPKGPGAKPGSDPWRIWVYAFLCAGIVVLGFRVGSLELGSSTNFYEFVCLLAAVATLIAFLISMYDRVRARGWFKQQAPDEPDDYD